MARARHGRTSSVKETEQIEAADVDIAEPSETESEIPPVPNPDDTVEERASGLPFLEANADDPGAQLPRSVDATVAAMMPPSGVIVGVDAATPDGDVTAITICIRDGQTIVKLLHAATKRANGASTEAGSHENIPALEHLAVRVSEVKNDIPAALRALGVNGGELADLLKALLAIL